MTALGAPAPGLTSGVGVAPSVRATVAAAAIRRATAIDHRWLVELGVRAFADLGDYREVLPAWLAQDNVMAWVDDPGTRRGFTMLAFYRDDHTGDRVADLLALSVEPGWRRHGLGRALLDHTIAMARASARAGRLTELRLCVAEDNHRAQRLYDRAGLTAVMYEPGRYAAGQRAIRMTYPLR